MDGKIKSLVVGIVFVIVGFVLVFYLVGGLAPTLTTASSNISGSGLPYLLGLIVLMGVCSLIIFEFGSFVADTHGGHLHSLDSTGIQTIQRQVKSLNIF